MLGMNLVTIQTGPSGRIVKRLLIEEGWTSNANSTSACWSTAKPLGSSSWPAAQAAWRLKKSPKKIPAPFFTNRSTRQSACSPISAQLAFGLGLAGEAANRAAPFFQALYRAFVDTDASMLEINPCVLTGDAGWSLSTPK